MGGNTAAAEMAGRGGTTEVIDAGTAAAEMAGGGATTEMIDADTAAAEMAGSGGTSEMIDGEAAAAEMAGGGGTTELIDADTAAAEMAGGGGATEMIDADTAAAEMTDGGGTTDADTSTSETGQPGGMLLIKFRALCSSSDVDLRTLRVVPVSPAMASVSALKAACWDSGGFGAGMPAQTLVTVWRLADMVD